MIYLPPKQSNVICIKRNKACFAVIYPRTNIPSNNCVKTNLNDISRVENSLTSYPHSIRVRISDERGCKLQLRDTLSNYKISHTSPINKSNRKINHRVHNPVSETRQTSRSRHATSRYLTILIKTPYSSRKKATKKLE